MTAEKAFSTGILTGVLLLVGVLIIFNLTPMAITEKLTTQHNQEAIDRGFGSWVVNTNSFKDGYPTTTFQWNTNKTK